MVIYTPNMAEDLIKIKYEKLVSIITTYKSALIAFSGGVDSSYLAYASHKLLGDSMLAVTVDAPWIPRREIREASDVAAGLHIPHKIIKTEFLPENGFFKNPSNRCYICKTGIFTQLKRTADEEGLEHIFEGTNADDAGVYRPGLKALEELNIVSPLKEAGLTKDDIRALSRKAGLPTADKPAYACLASRFPYETKLTIEGFRRVEQAEDFLFTLGFNGLRVRDHFPIARIEIPVKMMSGLLDAKIRADIVNTLKSLGYGFVTLDLEGYRSGCFDDQKHRKE